MGGLEIGALYKKREIMEIGGLKYEVASNAIVTTKKVANCIDGHESTSRKAGNTYERTSDPDISGICADCKLHKNIQKNAGTICPILYPETDHSQQESL